MKQQELTKVLEMFEKMNPQNVDSVTKDENLTTELRIFKGDIIQFMKVNYYCIDGTPDEITILPCHIPMGTGAESKIKLGNLKSFVNFKLFSTLRDVQNFLDDRINEMSQQVHNVSALNDSIIKAYDNEITKRSLLENISLCKRVSSELETDYLGLITPL